MAWQVKDEWIDPGLARHYVVLHNPDVLVDDPETGGKKPVEHHLCLDMRMWACALCGRPHPGDAARGVIDLNAVKAETIEALHRQHRRLLDQKEAHPRVRVGTGLKK